VAHSSDGNILGELNDSIVAGLNQRLAALRVSLTAEPVSLATLPEDQRRAWVTPDGKARLEVFPKGDARDTATLRRFVAAVRTVAPDATGTPVTIQESGATVVGAFVRAGCIAIVAMTVLLAVLLRRVVDVLLVLAPLLLAGLMTAATGVALGLPLNYANIITLPLLLGIGVAFDIYFVMRWRAGLAGPLQSSTARAVLFSALTTTTAFGSLALSSHPGTAEMGRLLTIALFFTLVCTFAVLPALQGPVRR
jgi:predicted RND superfamily exporter protein